MGKIKKHIRMIVLAILIVIAFIASMITLMRIQIVQGEELLAQSIRNEKGKQEVVAPRGEILDINGVALVANKVTFDVIIEYALFPKDVQEQNAIILDIVKFLKNNGVEWQDNLPITYKYPFEYTDAKEKMFSNVMKSLNVNVYATPEDCIHALIERFEIADTYTDEEKRIIAGIRYEMIYQGFSMSVRYTFAKDISTDMVMSLKEMAYKYPGTDIVESAERIYPDGILLQI